MRISVAMATFNGARYLRQQIESLARQTLLPHELVVCDDGSEDETVDILRDFGREAPFPVRVAVNETRLRVGDNFLKSASLCRGEAIAFCDQDDVWLEHKLARCAEALADDEIVLVIHTARVVDHRLEPTGELHPNIPRSTVVPPLRADITFLPQGCATVFDARLLSLLDYRLRPRRLDEEYPRISHDAWTYLLASVTGKILLLAEPLALYRQHDANVVGASDPRLRSRTQTSLRTGVETYRRHVVIWDDWAALLEGLAASEADAAKRERYAAAAARYLRLKGNLELRCALYEPGASRAQRIACFGRLLGTAGYGRRLRGGLGPWALLKDAAVAVAGGSLSRPTGRAPD